MDQFFGVGVPDVDDTSGAILALLELYTAEPDIDESIISGCRWLTTLQNRDGGFPTFCKGWGRLPFDSSCADLTGHALHALTKSMDMVGGKMGADLQSSVNLCIARAMGFLWKAQQENGCWYPLWFGNQFTPDQKNPVYGTAKVAIYLKDSLACKNPEGKIKESIQQMLLQAQNYLLKQQNPDGSWGGAKDISGTVEESALALSALTDTDQEVLLRGFGWIDNEINKNGLHSNPIGLYFAMLWYDEKLYPLIYTLEALRRYLK